MTWEPILRRHSASVQRFLNAAAALNLEQWRAPVAPGKWTPEQITAHVVQTYVVLTRQLRTGEGIPVQTSGLRRRVLRAVVLPIIMWTRRLPPGAKAAPLLMPPAAQIGKDELLTRLTDVVREFEAALQAGRHDTGLRLTHHVFGSVDAVKGVDFVAVHTEHHARQLVRLLHDSDQSGRRASSRP